MKRVFELTAIVALILCSSCEKILMHQVEKVQDRIEERRERRNVHPFEIFLTTAEPELDYVRFYGESQDVKSVFDTNVDNWFSIFHNLDGSFDFTLENRIAWFTDNTYTLVSIYLDSITGTEPKINTRYYFGDTTGRELDGPTTNDGYVDLTLVNIKEDGHIAWEYTSTFGWIEFTYIGSNEASNNPFIYDNAAIVDISLYFECVDPTTGELLLKAEDCTMTNCWGSRISYQY